MLSLTHIATVTALLLLPSRAARDSIKMADLGMATAGCPGKSKDECEKSNSCFTKQAGDPKCADAIPDNCPGMNQEHCGKVPELCHFDYTKANKDWKKACFPGPKESAESPACVLRKNELECKKDCFWRPNKQLQCAPKEAKYCQGMRGDQCQKETDTCHWELKGGDWEKACKGGKAEAKAKPVAQTQCPAELKEAANKEKCMQNSNCMFRPGEPKATKCVDAKPENCLGMNHAGCDEHKDKCHWDGEKGGGDWKKSCVAGPAGGNPKPSTTTTTTTTSTKKTTSSTSTTSTTTPIKAKPAESAAGASCPTEVKEKAEKEACMLNSNCMFRPKFPKATKCVDAKPENCPGMNHAGCDDHEDKCHWDGEKGGGDWQKSCFAGPAIKKVPIKPHQEGESSSSTTTTTSTSSTKKTTSSTSTTSTESSTKKTTSSTSTTSTTSSTSTTSTTSSGASDFAPGILAVLAAASALLV